MSHTGTDRNGNPVRWDENQQTWVRVYTEQQMMQMVYDRRVARLQKIVQDNKKWRRVIAQKERLLARVPRNSVAARNFRRELKEARSNYDLARQAQNTLNTYASGPSSAAFQRYYQQARNTLAALRRQPVPAGEVTPDNPEQLPANARVSQPAPARPAPPDPEGLAPIERRPPAPARPAPTPDPEGLAPPERRPPAPAPLVSDEREAAEQRRLQEQADRAKREAAEDEPQDTTGDDDTSGGVPDLGDDGVPGGGTPGGGGGTPGGGTPGGGTPGGGTPGGEETPTEEPVSDELTAEQKEFFRKQFGGLAFFMGDKDENDELFQIVLKVAREGITDVNRVLGLVQKTKWYQENSALARRFDVLYAEEGEVGQREMIDEQYDAINQAARRLGFVIEDERLQELAYQASRLGLEESEVAELIAAEQNFDPGYLADSAKQLASRYYISLDDAAADDYGTKLFVGDVNQQTLEAMFREQAKGRFPSLTNIIDSGISPETYFAPYKAQIAQLLEINSNQVDLMNDTRFSTIIDYIPDAGGDARPMTMNEMQRYVRRLDDWQYTDNAKAAASQLVDAIGRRFGRTA